MKIISWNCRGAFRKKKKFIENIDADLYVIQEVEHPNKWTDDKSIFKLNHFIYKAFEGDKLGILIYSHNFEIKEKSIPDFNMRYFVSFICNNLDFVGIWTKDNYISDIHTYCLANENKLRNSIFIGDFNSSINFDTGKTERLYRGFYSVDCWMKDQNNISCYHTKFQENYGKESIETFWQFRNNTKHKYHIDYCFIPNHYKYDFNILKEMTDLAILDKKISADHYPLLLELF